MENSVLRAVEIERPTVKEERKRSKKKLSLIFFFMLRACMQIM